LVFVLHFPPPSRHPPSFPTRRSSDLTKRITVYVRPDRTGRVASEIRNDITVCEGAVQKAYSDVSPGYSFARFMASYYTGMGPYGDRKSTRLNSSHDQISYAVFCLKKK